MTSIYTSPQLLPTTTSPPSRPRQPGRPPLPPLPTASIPPSALPPPSPSPRSVSTPPSRQTFTLGDAILFFLPSPALSDHACLDVGCGRGMVLLKLAHLKKTLNGNVPPQKRLTYGIDIFSTGDQSGNALEASWANVAAAGLTDAPVLHTASFTEALPLADGVFGVVASSLAMHNIRAEWRRKAVEMARVCSPGGWIVVLDLVGYVGGYAEVLRDVEGERMDGGGSEVGRGASDVWGLAA